MPALGSDAEYDAVIAFSASPEQAITSLPFSQIDWQRLHNETSTAKIVVPGADGGIEACGFFGGLRPWDHMLRIYRNGYLVWDGPITSWNRPGSSGDLEITAKDRSAMFERTLVGASRHWDAGTVAFEDAIVRVILDTNYFAVWPYAVNFETTPTPGFALRPPPEIDLRVERLDTLRTALNSIGTNTSFFWTTQGSSILMCEDKVRNRLTNNFVLRNYPLAFDNNWLILNEQTTIGVPTVSVDGNGLATVIYVGAATQGANGHPIVATSDVRTVTWVITAGPPPPYIASRLQSGRTDSTNANDVSNVARASEVAAVEAATPNLTIEQITLSPEFGGTQLLPDLSNLLPGVRLKVDFEETCAFNVPVSRRADLYAASGQIYLLWSGSVKHVRLEQLDVSVSTSSSGEVTEAVQASCIPTVEYVYPIPQSVPGIPGTSYGIF